MTTITSNTQKIAPLFGEEITDAAMALAALTSPGVVEAPGVAFSGSGTARTLQLVPGARGFWAWVPNWEIAYGAQKIIETGTITIPLGADPATKRVVAVVGRYKWAPGALGAGMKPLGTLAEAQKAVYEATAGTDGATPGAPSISTTDAQGRLGVVLGYVTMTAGQTPTWAWNSAALIDLAYLATKLDGMHRRSGAEYHDGPLEVSEAPTTDKGVVRKIDLENRAAIPFASFAKIKSSMPDNWGAGYTTCTLQAATQSGTDITRSGNTFVAATAGLYRLHGVVYQWPGCGNHDVRLKVVVHRAVANTDETVIDTGESDCSGSITMPFGETISMAPGDTITLTGTSKGGGAITGQIEYMGVLASTAPLEITTTDKTWMAASGQTYPAIRTVTLAAANATGAVAFSITGGTAAGFCSIAGSTLTISIPSVGGWTLNLRATDSRGTADKTLAITMQAYSLTPVTIGNSANYNFEADGYPFDPAITLTASGGTSPYTWSIVAGADTTMPGAAIVSGALHGAIAEGGTTKARVRATDSTTPVAQTEEKVITVAVIDYVPPPDPGPYCFADTTTWILMADGTGKLLCDVLPGDMVLAITDAGHEQGYRTARPTLVTDVILHEGTMGTPLHGINGILGTAEHLWAEFGTECQGCQGRVLGEWTRTDQLGARPIVQVLPSGYTKEAPAERTGGGASQNLRNLSTQAHTYCVGATQEGPFFAVHNQKLTPQV